MPTIVSKTLRQQWGWQVAKLREIDQKLQREGNRALSDGEASELIPLLRGADSLAEDIEREEGLKAGTLPRVQRKNARGKDGLPALDEHRSGVLKDDLENAATVDEYQRQPVNGGTPQSRGAARSKPHDGFLTKDQRFVDHVPDRSGARAGDLSLARIVRGVVTGRWSDAEEERTALGSATGGGSYLLPQMVSSTVIDYARSRSVCMAAGAVSTPVEGSFKIPRIAGDPTVQWKAENAARTSDSEVNFEGLTIAPKTLFCIVRAPVELIEDSTPNLEALLASTIQRAMGAQLDRAALLGGGTNGPDGLYGDSGVHQTDVDAAIAYTNVSEAVEAVTTRNYSPNGIVLGMRPFYELDRKVSAVELQPLFPFPSYAALAKYPTSSIADDPSGGQPAFVGQWNMLLFAIRTDFRVEVSRLDTDSLNKLQVAIRVFGRFDVGAMAPAAFEVMDNLT